MIRLINAVKVGWLAFRHPHVLKKSNLKLAVDLLNLILKVSLEDKHMMTHIGFVYPDEGEKQIVSIWAGAGLAAEPTKRISELISENTVLKEKLTNALSRKIQ